MAICNEIMASAVHEALRIDGQYYLPNYVKNEITLSELESKRLPVEFSVSDGNHMGISRYFSDIPGGIPYYRGQDINDFFLDNANPVYIPYSIYEKPLMARSHFKEGDVLLTIVGTIGNVAVVTGHNIPATGSCKIAILRSKGKMNPHYLSAFLLSKYGQLQIKRNIRGAVQTGLILEDMYRIRIPVVDAGSEEEIENLITASINENRKSKSLYTQAKQVMDSELGLDKLVFEKPIGYESSLNDVIKNNRADADFYQIPFRQIEAHLSNLKTKPLFKIASVDKGIEVGSNVYTSSGKLFIRVSNVKESGIALSDSDKYIPDSLYEKLSIFRPQVGELILTKDGTPGVCYVIDKAIEGIISSGIVKLRIIDKDIPSEYLALAINSEACRMQIDRACSGALIMHWRPNYLYRLKIPILSSKIMQDLDDKVDSAKKAKRESEKLLRQAKQRVEELIEEAVRNELN